MFKVGDIVRVRAEYPMAAFRGHVGRVGHVKLESAGVDFGVKNKIGSGVVLHTLNGEIPTRTGWYLDSVFIEKVKETYLREYFRA
jgi:hypothetical protein